MPHSKSSGGDLIRRSTRLTIYARDGFRCAVCGYTPPGAVYLASLVNVLQCGSAYQACLLPPPTMAGREMFKGLTLDHFRPPARGGSMSAPRNLVTMCRSCNSSKKSRPLSHVFPSAVRHVRNLRRRRVNRELGRQLCRVIYPKRMKS